MSSVTKPTLTFAYGSQPSRAVRWFIAKNKLDVASNVVQFQDLRGPELSARNPWQAVPFLELPGQTVALSESAAILQYLASTNSVEADYPTDPVKRARVHEMLFKHDGLGRKVTMVAVRPFILALFGQRTVEDAKAEVAKDASALVAVLNDLEWALSRNRYVAGDTFSLADYLLVCELNQLPALEAVEGTPESLHLGKHFPNLTRYLQTVNDEDPLCAAHVAEFVKICQTFKPRTAAPAATA